MSTPKENKSKQPRRRTRNKRKPQKRYKIGKITRNPFLNFLRYCRKAKRGQPVADIARKAGKLWKKMSERDRSPYNNMARKAPMRRRTRKKNKVETSARELKKVCEEKRIEKENQQSK